MPYVDNVCGNHAPKPHNEYICHGTTQQRYNILKELSCLLKGADTRKCLLRGPKTCGPLHERPPPPQPKLPPKVKTVKPLITYTGVVEVRTTSDPHKAVNDPPYVTYKPYVGYCGTKQPKDPTGTKSIEIIGGKCYDCRCVKRNGLQADCPRTDCLGRPECLAMNPGPCCKPALHRFMTAKQKH